MRALILSTFLLTMALAGCFGGGDADPTPTPTSSPTPTPVPTASPSPTPSPTPTPGANQPPTASLSASIQQGEVPVNVTFSLNGSDPAGDPITWTLDLGDGNDSSGAELPATVEHSYTQAGLYEVVFTVSDGQLQTTRNLTINATAAAGGEPGATTQQVSAEWMFDNPYAIGAVAGNLEEDAFPAQLDGVTFAHFLVEPGTYGKPFHAVYGCAAQAVDGIAFYDGDGERLLRATDLDDGDFCDIQGIVPDGAVNGYFWSAGGGDSVEYSAG